MNIVEFIQCDSRNYNKGRFGVSIDHIVVHYSGTSASAHNNLKYFGSQSAEASAHLFIDKNGDVRQSVKFGDTAWHSGNRSMNRRSIGIEVIGAGEDFTEAQIASLTAVIAELKKTYGIKNANVIRHYDVTGKRCPAAYVSASKWKTLHARICGGSASSGSSGSSSGSGSGSSVDIDKLAKDVIAGKYGNGDARKKALGSNYSAVQKRVNEMLSGKSSSGSSSSSVDIDALARAVIRGDYGNGETRKKKLGSLYSKVQKRVNELLK